MEIKRELKSESVEIKDDLVFNLHIGANLRELGEPLEQAVGSIGSDRSFRIFIYYKDEAQTYQAYAVSLFVTVDENNRYFYSDELGRMYYKDTNKLVDAFFYRNRESFPENSLPKYPNLTDIV